MKLRNKKTGEIIETSIACGGFTGLRKCKTYFSLADLCEEWEDYQDDKPWHPKRGEEFYYIGDNGIVHEDKLYYNAAYVKAYNRMLFIGNCFRTKEEAEQAVEKLKAWRRLKYAGFKFDGLDKDRYDDTVISTNIDDLGDGDSLPNEISKDLDLLFGGDDED